MLNFNKKGFAFSELLMVTVVILGIFMIVYTNIFPIMGELENRKEYNDLSTNYVAFYLRRELLNEDLSSLLSGSSNYFILYDVEIDPEGNENIVIHNVLSKYSDFLSLVKAEKVILTKDVLINLKSASVLSELPDLSDYIDYLPVYNNLDDGIEQYRLIIKTKTGYANTLIKFVPDDYSEIFEFDDDGKIIQEVKETSLETLSIPDFVTGISSAAFDLESLSNLKNVYMNSLKIGTSEYIDVDSDSFIGARNAGNELNLYIYDCAAGSELDVKSGLNISDNNSIDLNCIQSAVGGAGEDE